MAQLFDGACNGWNWTNNTGKGADLLITIVGCEGENTSAHHGIEGQDREFYYKLGRQGASVRVYTSTLELDRIIVGGKGSLQALATTGGKWRWSDYARYHYDYYRGTRWWQGGNVWEWNPMQNTLKQTQQGRTMSFVYSLKPGESIYFERMPNNERYQTSFQLCVHTCEGNHFLPFEP
ncbi:hypothetical protein [Helicobacter salomonis]|uniref:hypothetical protein n=1 Tax=Helicobacter salomonis TaxID=56878 RepID=UPI000CF0C2EC|nr:hypothetical protein [Helicobacter salomonis]